MKFVTLASRLWVVLGCMLVAVGCSKDAAVAPEAGGTKAQATPAVKNPYLAQPDFGGVKRVVVEAEGIGSSQELAVLAALQSAVAQVNGVKVASSLQSVRAGISSEAGGTVQSASAEAFLSKAMAASGGSVLGYRIVESRQVTELDSETVRRVRQSDEGGSFKASASEEYEARAKATSDSASASAESSYAGNASVEAERGATSYELDERYRKMRSYWKVKLAADIARFEAPDEKGRPKIVVAAPRVSSETYEVGDSRVASSEVARAIRGRLNDALTQTHRFIVLDREFSAELQDEIDHINSGNVRPIDAARVGQQLATDLILIPTIEQFAYPRSTRELRMSSRQVVSYSGGGRVMLRLVNATTGEVVMSQTFEHMLSPTGPSTLPRVVDGTSLANALMDELSGQMGKSVVAQIFPITVVAVMGNRVVLSQGGDAVRVGETYDAVRLGEELTDPQTGQSLGRMELPCCKVRIERVERQTAYGVVDDPSTVPASKGFVAGSIRLTRMSAPEQTARPVAETGSRRKTEVGTRPSAPAEADGGEAEDENW